MITFNEWLEKIDEVVTTRPKGPNTKDYASGDIKNLNHEYMAHMGGETLTPDRIASLKQKLELWADVAKDLPVYKALEAKLKEAKPNAPVTQKGMTAKDLSGTDASDFQASRASNVRRVRKPALKKPAPKKPGLLGFLSRKLGF